jgi:hypothetical protein
MRFLPTFALFVLPLGAVTLTNVRDAHACGGCFGATVSTTPVPGTPPQSTTVVTDHRMVVALSGDSTTLWDQIQYAGDPGEFSWVLPVRGAAVVGVGSNSFIDALDQQTTPVVHAPDVQCNRITGGGGGSMGPSCGCGSASADDGAAANNGTPVDGGKEGVTVTSQETVGPYEVVQLYGPDAATIFDWLKGHGYLVSPAIEPTIQAYVDEGFGFLAVRLQPGKDVQSMRPIRVTWSGKDASLPLRMVAAGVGDKVGIKLLVVGDGRWTTSSFPSFTIDANALTWDFAAQRSDYTATRDRQASSFGYAAFALESSIDVSASSIPPGDPPPDVDAGPTSDAGDAGEAGADVGVTPTESDVDIAFGTHATRRVTRLRGDIVASALAKDLSLQADADQTVRGVDLVLTKWSNPDAVCPDGYLTANNGYNPYNPYPAYDSGAYGSILRLRGNAGGCSTGSSPSPLARWSIGIAIGAIALALARRASR